MTGRTKFKIGWTILIFGTLVLWAVAFSLMEGYGLSHDDAITLSRYVWEAQQAWPLLLPLVSYLVGAIQWGFLVHILWRWDPTNVKDHRGCLVFLAASSLLLLGTSVQARDLTIPDPAITPGVARTDITQENICETKWGKDARHVTPAMKRKVFEAYDLSGNTDKACVRDSHGRRCEIDHCISRELGGADVIENLWPQPYGTKTWNATRKDRVENRLHVEVCAGRILLEVAQREVCEDYRVPYQRYFGEPK